MAMQKNACAMGQFPMQGDVSTDPERFTQPFAPRGEIRNVNGVLSAMCHGCDQWTLVKSAAPRKGYFNIHKSSVQREAPGFSMGSTSNNKSGKPARVRGREIYVRKKD
jgi:hypothetical protein